MQIMDSEDRYGLPSRLVHWAMAFLILGMLATGIIKEFVEDSPLERTFMAYHKSIGIAVLALLVVRLAWRKLNHAPRPLFWARVGHLGLYMLMLLMPVSGLLMAWGSGHGAAFFGQAIIAPGEKVQWARELGNELHEIGQFLLWGLIAGHAGAAIFHRFIKRDPAGQRMF